MTTLTENLNEHPIYDIRVYYTIHINISDEEIGPKLHKCIISQVTVY
jgi:hypothetical protein